MKNHGLLRTLGAASTLLYVLFADGVQAQTAATPPTVVPGPGQKWAATWTAAPISTFPGDAATDAAIPDAATTGAFEQTLRMIVKPDLWGNTMRFRFSNTFGNRVVLLNRAAVGLQTSGANLQKGTTTPLTFNGGSANVAIPAGQEIYSDPVTLGFVAGPDDPSVQGRKLAVSFYVQGTTGPLTYHWTGLTSSYLTGSDTGDHTQEENDASYPFTTGGPYGPSFLLDGVDVLAPAATSVVCVFGDSITDHVFMTFNGDDSWPDQLSRRLHAAYGNTVSVVNEAISGNRVSDTPSPTGQAAVDRLDRDVLGVAGLNHVVWLEGINDLGNGATAADVEAGYQNVVARLHQANVTVVGVTLLSSLSPARTGFGSDAVNAQRQQLNAFIRTASLFDGVADMDAATVDPGTGCLQAPYATHSFSDPAPDDLHPGRAGCQVMASCVDLGLLAPVTTAQ